MGVYFHQNLASGSLPDMLTVPTFPHPPQKEIWSIQPLLSNVHVGDLGSHLSLIHNRWTKVVT